MPIPTAGVILTRSGCANGKNKAKAADNAVVERGILSSAWLVHL